MIRRVVNSGDSRVLVLTKDMREHMGLTANEIDVQFESGGKITLSKPEGKGEDKQ